MPSLKATERPEDRLRRFQQIEARFAWQARAWVLLAGASGFWLVALGNLWSRFVDGQFWWMHLMVALWALFTLMLFVIEPLHLHRRLAASTTPPADFARMMRLHHLLLNCMRGLTDVTRWNQTSLKIAFWSLNIGIAVMTFRSLLPQGILQTYASIEHGYAFARSAQFIHSPIMQALVWARVPGDLVFSVGVFAFAWFMFRAFLPGKTRNGIEARVPIAAPLG